MNDFDKVSNEPKSSSQVLFGYLRAFLMPALVGKTMILYFGIHYSNYPGDGYGYGLVASIAFTLSMLGLFLWKTREKSTP